MESVMANQVDEKQWYLAVGERSLGPLSTSLVARGIQSGKVPVTAWICQVGDSGWSALSSFSEFQSALERALPSSSPANEAIRASGAVVAGASSESTAEEETSQVETRQHLQQSADCAVDDGPGSRVPQVEAGNASDGNEEEPTGRRSLLPYERTDLPLVADNAHLPGFGETASDSEAKPALDAFSSEFGLDESNRGENRNFSDVSGQREVDPWVRKEVALAFEAHQIQAFSPAVAEANSSHATDEDDLGIDITFDEDESNSIDWQTRFQSYFLVGSEIQLPEEEKLLQSLSETPKSTFLHDEALWNLALCLAFGSDTVAEATASTFYEALAPERAHATERVEWICRTLLSKGFMPSGIPRIEGNRGIDVLRQQCPAALADVLEREASF